MWIPVTTNYPSLGERVIAVYTAGNPESTDPADVGLVVGEVTYEGGSSWTRHGVALSSQSVKFWQPMPEPYRFIPPHKRDLLG